MLKNKQITYEYVTWTGIKMKFYLSNQTGYLLLQVIQFNNSLLLLQSDLTFKKECLDGTMKQQSLQKCFHLLSCLKMSFPTFTTSLPHVCPKKRSQINLRKWAVNDIAQNIDITQLSMKKLLSWILRWIVISVGTLMSNP